MGTAVQDGLQKVVVVWNCISCAAIQPPLIPHVLILLEVLGPCPGWSNAKLHERRRAFGVHGMVHQIGMRGRVEHLRIKCRPITQSATFGAHLTRLCNFGRFCGRQTARHTKPPPVSVLHVHNDTQTASVHTRAGALTFPSSCLDGGVTRVGPGQNPQYTRAPLGEEAVGWLTEQSPQHTATTNEHNNTSHETMKSRLVAEPWSNHGNRVTANVTGDGVEYAEPHRRS